MLGTYRVKNNFYDLCKLCYSLSVKPWKCKFSMFHYLNFGSIPSLELDLSIIDVSGAQNKVFLELSVMPVLMSVVSTKFWA